MLIQLPPIPLISAVVNALISFTRIACPIAGAGNNHKTLTKGVTLKVIHGLLRHFELLTVRRGLEMSRRHTINELLECGNQARIKSRRGSPGGHGDVDFRGSEAAIYKKTEDLRRRRKRRKKTVGMAFTRWNTL